MKLLIAWVFGGWQNKTHMKKLSERCVYEGQWLSVHETICENKQGQQTCWESIRRKKSSVGVVVLARMIHSRKIIFIKQFRPAINGYLLSLPAGLGFNDPNHALVELKEETGYTGKIAAISPILKTGASLVDDSARVVCIDVDDYAPENQHPQQELEPGEDIEVFLAAKEEAWDFIKGQQEKGVSISANLWYLFGVGGWLG